MVVLAVDPGDVRKEKEKKKLHLRGWVVVTHRARTNGDVLSKLRGSNKKKKKNINQLTRVGGGRLHAW